MSLVDGWWYKQRAELKAELKAKDEQIASLRFDANLRLDDVRVRDERIAELESERARLQLAVDANVQRGDAYRFRMEKLDAENKALASRLDRAQGFLIEAEGMLCDPQGGPAANRCAEQIREFLASAVEWRRPAPVWVTEVEQDGDDTLIHLSDGRCATLMPPISEASSVADEGFKALASGSFAAPVVEGTGPTDEKGRPMTYWGGLACETQEKPITAVEKQLPQLHVTEIEQDGDELLYHLSDGRCAVSRLHKVPPVDMSRANGDPSDA